MTSIVRNTLVTLCLWAVSSLNADIAPTKFVGSNALPIESQDVRMADAMVKITWADPCPLQADFSLVNESGKVLEMEIGFPVGAYRRREFEFDDDNPKSPTHIESADPAMISIVVNGEAVPAFSKTPAERVDELRRGYASWYFAKVTLKSGVNAVGVTTKLTPSGVSGQPFKRLLSYCIWTGGRWKGPIGHERVTITFSNQRAGDFATDIRPSSGCVEGDAVVWDFNRIEPTGSEYDIDFEFWLPSVAAKLAELKMDHERAPADAKAALRYARHLFCLGWAKGNSGFPPEKFSQSEYQAVLSNIAGEAQRRVFTRFYPKRADGIYASESTEWTEDRLAMIQILSDAGFSEKYPEFERVNTARKLVEQCLANDPKNADAWALYLTQFWRFCFASRGHWFGSTVFGKPLRRAIDSAYKNCPDDPRIRAWKEAMEHDTQPPTVSPDSLSRDVPDAWKNEFKTDDSSD